MKKLLENIKSCRVCESYLPFLPRPIVQASATSKIVIIGQAPGRKVQESGIPWDDQSGKELRRWLQVTDEQFYNPELFALIPMGFCFPGSGKSGDLPPRPECAPLWHPQLLQEMKEVKLIILIGQYAQKRYLKEQSSARITDNIKNYHQFLPLYLPLVHPSPRNKIWQKKNPWFEEEVIPVLRNIVKEVI